MADPTQVPGLPTNQATSADAAYQAALLSAQRQAAAAATTALPTIAGVNAAAGGSNAGAGFVSRLGGAVPLPDVAPQTSSFLPRFQDPSQQGTTQGYGPGFQQAPVTPPIVAQASPLPQPAVQPAAAATAATVAPVAAVAPNPPQLPTIGIADRLPGYSVPDVSQQNQAVAPVAAAAQTAGVTGGPVALPGYQPQAYTPAATSSFGGGAAGAGPIIYRGDSQTGGGGNGVQNPAAAINDAFNAQQDRGQSLFDQALQFYSAGTDPFDKGQRSRLLGAVLPAAFGPNNQGSTGGAGADSLNAALASLGVAGVTSQTAQADTAATVAGQETVAAGNQRVALADTRARLATQPIEGTPYQTRNSLGLPVSVTPRFLPTLSADGTSVSTRPLGANGVLPTAEQALPQLRQANPGMSDTQLLNQYKLAHPGT